MINEFIRGKTNVSAFCSKETWLCSFAEPCFASLFIIRCDTQVSHIWCLRWDSNPHGFPHDFESFKGFNTYLFLVLNIIF